MSDIVDQLRQASLNNDDYRWKAADLIESLRQKTQYWPDNAERDAVIRHQKEVIDSLRDWNEEIALNARKLIADNERLRAALELFACDCAESEICKFPHACRNYIARATLNPAED